MLHEQPTTDPATPQHAALPTHPDDIPGRPSEARQEHQTARVASDATFEILREMVSLQRAEAPARERLFRTLALADKLLPEAQRLRLFVPTDHDAHAFDVLDSRENASNMVTTLGYGAAADHAALRAGQTIRQPHATIIPLTAGQSDAPAVFVADWRPHATRSQSESLLALVVEQFRALLDHLAQERREEELSTALEQQSQTFDTFISMTAHELRSPLTSIKGYAQLLVRQSRRTELPEAMLHSAEAIVEQGARMADMIEQLHDAARIRRDRLEIQCAPTDMVPLLREQAEQWPALFPSHSVQLAIMADSLVGDWDARRVVQVIQSLIENAARFSAEATTIAVEIRRQGIKAEALVRDEGIGVSERDKPHIFEYLYRSAEAEERNLTGLGLGLFVSSELAKRMGGSLQLVRSPLGPDGGSEFCLSLPLAD